MNPFIQNIIISSLIVLLLILLSMVIMKSITHTYYGKSGNITPEFRKNKLDVVYLWVDMNDPDWLSRKAEALGVSLPTNKGRIDPNDFRELEFSVLNTQKYMKDILGTIFIVTDGQTPSWINNDNLGQLNIAVVDLKEIMPPELTPCYNSDYIEMFIQRIPKLSKWFVYMNDDYIINNYVTYDNFFVADNVARFNNDGLGINPAIANVVSLGKAKTIRSRLMTDNLYKYKLPTTGYHIFVAHAPLIVNVDLMEELYNIFENDIYRTYNMVRTKDNLVLQNFVYPHYAIAKGYGKFSADYKCTYMVYSKCNWINKLQYKLIDKNKPDYFVINDTRDPSQNNKKNINYSLGSTDVSKTLVNWLNDRMQTDT